MNRVARADVRPRVDPQPEQPRDGADDARSDRPRPDGLQRGLRRPPERHDAPRPARRLPDVHERRRRRHPRQRRRGRPPVPGHGPAAPVAARGELRRARPTLSYAGSPCTRSKQNGLLAQSEATIQQYMESEDPRVLRSAMSRDGQTRIDPLDRRHARQRRDAAWVTNFFIDHRTDASDDHPARGRVAHARRGHLAARDRGPPPRACATWYSAARTATRSSASSRRRSRSSRTRTRWACSRPRTRATEKSRGALPGGHRLAAQGRRARGQGLTAVLEADERPQASARPR